MQQNMLEVLKSNLYLPKNYKIMKLFKKRFLKEKQKIVATKNIKVGVKTLNDIKIWETQKSDIIIRSNFNRELYYKYLETIKS